jgi:hypothetical protein
MVAFPVETPVITPVLKPAVAITVLLLVQLPPVIAFDNVEVEPAQIVVEPVIAGGLT